MTTPKIAFFDAKPYDIESFDLVNKGFNYGIKYFNNHLSYDTVALARGFDAVCVFVNDTLDSCVVEGLSECGIKLIALRCAGYNNVDLKSVYGKIHVARVPAYSPYAVAEHALALMLTLNRKTHKAYSRSRDNNFSINGLLGFDMHGKSIGVIGTGRIGMVLISIAKGLGMRVLAYDARPDTQAASSLGFEYVNLDELYGNSDIISLHCPLNDSTMHMINQESLKKMKDGVMVINTGRGKLIDTKALLDALKSGKVGYAGLDVYEEESEYFFEDYSTSGISDDVLARLLTFPNVLITSHQGFFTREAMQNIAETTLKNVKDFFEKGKFDNEICYHCDKSNGCRKKAEGRCF